ncbi:MAG: hypothetical protein KF858_13155 [Candidatus Sumerlaeia bacterium]|nr:hypothetical protein [Candidatus Sumerlaeia bacterium]
MPPVYGQTLAASAQQTPPGMVQATAIIFLVAGIISVFWAAAWAIGSACCWLPWIVEFVAGIAAITTGAQMLAAPPGPPKKWVSILLIVCVLNCSLFALTAGILTLVFANDARVRDYYLARGITY